MVSAHYFEDQNTSGYYTTAHPRDFLYKMVFVLMALSSKNGWFCPSFSV